MAIELNSRLTAEQHARLLHNRPVRVVEGGQIMSGPVRLSFPNLAKMHSINNGKPKYGASGLYYHTAIGPLHQALVAAVRRDYPNVTDPNILIDPKNKNHPLKDQGLKVSTADGGLDPMRGTLQGYRPGYPYIAPKSGKAVPCFQSQAGKWGVVTPEEIEKVFYPGCWVEMKLVIFKSTSTANPGPVLGLQGVWKIADDLEFSGGGAGASADEGGDAGDVITIEDPNTAAGMAGGGWGGNVQTPSADVWDD